MRKSEGGYRGRGGWVAEIEIGEGEVRSNLKLKRWVLQWQAAECVKVTRISQELEGCLCHVQVAEEIGKGSRSLELEVGMEDGGLGA